MNAWAKAIARKYDDKELAAQDARARGMTCHDIFLNAAAATHEAKRITRNGTVEDAKVVRLDPKDGGYFWAVYVPKFQPMDYR